MKYVSALCLCVLGLRSILASIDNSEDTGLSNGLKVVYNMYMNCEKQEDMGSCLKLKALKFADRALKLEKISVFDGLTIVKSPEDSRDGRKMAQPLPDVNESALPEDPAKRQEALDDLMYERLDKFLQTHTIQMDTPRFLTEALDADNDADPSEERKKRGGMKKILLLGLMMKGGLMAMAYKGVALLAGKALMVAKIALVLSAVVALKKLVGGGGEEKVTYEIVKHPQVSHSHSYSSGHYGGGDFGGGHYDSSGGGGGHYKRSLDPEEAAKMAQLLAYHQQIPEQQLVQPQQLYAQ